jgi:glycosyltransferase involved in cell wall biosynthesis
MRLLLIGHLSSHVSGSSLSFEQLVDILRNNDRVEVEVVNTARPARLTSNWLVNAVVALKVTASVLLCLRKIDVVTFHASRSAIMLYGPVLFLLARLFRKPLVVRLFGGTLEQEYELLSPARRWLLKRTVFSVDLLLLQTKHLIGYFAQHGARCVRWYPTSRQILFLPPMQEDTIPSCKRFVFLGRVIKEKGIGIILESVSQLKSEISVDIFGSLDGHYSAEHINSEGRGVVHYKGILTPEEVRDELFNYDALILPTFYQGEGYPGVILEAYSHGLPVITTRWRSIPEIVDENSGILIPTHSAEALAQALNILYTDRPYYVRLRRGALDKRLSFSDRFWAERFVDWCTEVAKGVPPSQQTETM